MITEGDSVTLSMSEGFFFGDGVEGGGSGGGGFCKTSQLGGKVEHKDASQCCPAGISYQVKGFK